MGTWRKAPQNLPHLLLPLPKKPSWPLSTQPSFSPHPAEVTPGVDFAALKFHKSPGLPSPHGCAGSPWTDTRLHCLTAHLGGIRRKEGKKRQEVLSALKIGRDKAEKLKFAPKSVLHAQEGASLPRMGVCPHPGSVLGHFSPTPFRSPALALHNPSSVFRDLPASSWFVIFVGNSEFLGKASPVPVMFLSFPSDTPGWGGSW